MITVDDIDNGFHQNNIIKVFKTSYSLVFEEIIWFVAQVNSDPQRDNS